MSVLPTELKYINCDQCGAYRHVRKMSISIERITNGVIYCQKCKPITTKLIPLTLAKWYKAYYYN